MADAVIELLRMCNAQVDPNLLALSSEKAKSDIDETKPSKRRKKKERATSDANTSKAEAKQCDGDHSDPSDDDQFAHLGSNKIVLKRALHVSDAEESESD